MEGKLKAFSTPIPKGLIRILLRINAVECEIENDAPDFINPKEDSPRFKATPEVDISDLTDVFLKNYSLSLNEQKSTDKNLVWEVEEGGIWFDIEMDEVKRIWLSDFSFFIESEKPRYLAYYIKNVDHNIEWLQTDEKSGEIRSLSNYKKKFHPPVVSGKDSYSGSDVMKCADMLGRAVRKIDIRTGAALVKFNTDRGRLEPLITGIGEKMGYKIERLNKETILKQEEKGDNVSHSISLK